MSATAQAEQKKTCSACRNSLTLEQFHKHPLGSYGRQSRCKSCLADYCRGRKEAIRNGSWEPKRPKGAVVRKRKRAPIFSRKRWNLVLALSQATDAMDDYQTGRGDPKGLLEDSYREAIEEAKTALRFHNRGRTADA